MWDQCDSSWVTSRRESCRRAAAAVVIRSFPEPQRSSVDAVYSVMFGLFLRRPMFSL